VPVPLFGLALRPDMLLNLDTALVQRKNGAMLQRNRNVRS